MSKIEDNRETSDGQLFAGCQPESFTLTKDILDTLSVEEIVYAEYAEGGAMGNTGGVIIYIIKDGQLCRYETSLFNDETLYKNAADKLEENSDSPDCDNANNNGILKYYEDRFGNYVFINKNIKLNIEDGYFTYLKNGKTYQIYSSVQGVFNSVAYQLGQKTHKTPAYKEKALKKLPKNLESLFDHVDTAKRYMEAYKKEKNRNCALRRLGDMEN